MYAASFLWSFVPVKHNRLAWCEDTPPPPRFTHINQIIPYNPNINSVAPVQSGLVILRHNLPKLKGDMVFWTFLIFLATQLKRMQRIYFTISSPLLWNLPKRRLFISSLVALLVWDVILLIFWDRRGAMASRNYCLTLPQFFILTQGPEKIGS